LDVAAGNWTHGKRQGQQREPKRNGNATLPTFPPSDHGCGQPSEDQNKFAKHSATYFMRFPPRKNSAKTKKGQQSAATCDSFARTHTKNVS